MGQGGILELSSPRYSEAFVIHFRKKQAHSCRLCKGIKGAKETAYKAVLRPVEGTILTVIRVLDEHSKELSNLESFEALFEKMEEIALDTVKKLHRCCQN